MVRFVGKEIYGMAQFGKRKCGIVVFGNDFEIKAGDCRKNSWLMSVM